MHSPKRLIWFMLTALLGMTMMTALIVLVFSYFLNLRSETHFLMKLSQGIGQRFEQASLTSDSISALKLLQEDRWQPAQLALWDRNGHLVAGSVLSTDHMSFFNHYVPSFGEKWNWDENGLNYMRPMESGPYQGLWLRVRMDATPQAWDMDYFPALSAVATLGFLILGLSWFISQRLQIPLDALRRGVENISRGVYTRLPSSEWEELDILVKAMNSMSSELEGKILRLHEQSQEKDAILTALDEGVVALDLRGRILEANRRACELLKLGDEENWRKVRIEKRVRNTRLQALVGRLISGEEVDVEDLEFPFEQGVREMEVRGTALRGPEGQTWGAVLVFADQTQIHHLEKVRRDFVANVSHELRTPITSIQGFAETLASGDVSEPAQQKQFIGIIERQTKRLSNIIDDLLELSRLDQQMGIGEVEKEMVNLQLVFDQILQSVQQLLEDKRFELEIICPPNLQLRCNAHLIEQAVLNLVTNAMRYSDPAKKIYVEARNFGNNVEILVQDQGYGIPTKHLDRIFERFYRVDKARSRSQGGTGLGLSIVRNIAVAHGGEVSVRSELGVGSTFTLLLPG